MNLSYHRIAAYDYDRLNRAFRLDDFTLVMKADDILGFANSINAGQEAEDAYRNNLIIIKLKSEPTQKYYIKFEDFAILMEELGI